MNGERYITPDHVRNMVTLREDGALEVQQQWIFRCLMHFNAYRELDATGYRNLLVENSTVYGGPTDRREALQDANAVAYWVEWMEHRQDPSTVARNQPNRYLSGTHLSRAVDFLTRPGIAEALMTILHRGLSGITGPGRVGIA